MKDETLKAVIRFAARDFRVFLLAAIAWAIALLLGAASLWFYVLPMLAICVGYVAIMFQLLSAPWLVRVVICAVAPLPGLVLRWGLLSNAESGGAALERELIVATGQAVVVVSILAAIPAMCGAVMRQLGSKFGR